MRGNIEVILVDIGNTQIKSAEVVNGAILEITYWESIEELSNAYSKDTHYMLSSTRSGRLTLPNAIHLDHLTPIPITHQYQTIETLGTDRIASLVGAYELFPDQNSLVIDLGTCMTMDLITQEGVFMGGIISPGLQMRMKAMSQYTTSLPDISEEWHQYDNDLLGTTTKECLYSGSYNAIINEIQGTIQRLEADFTSINVIISGGDAQHFESRVKAHIFAGSKIVLLGLYRIWRELMNAG